MTWVLAWASVFDGKFSTVLADLVRFLIGSVFSLLSVDMQNIIP
jgi:hypothetical protein